MNIELRFEHMLDRISTTVDDPYSSVAQNTDDSSWTVCI